MNPSDKNTRRRWWWGALAAVAVAAAVAVSVWGEFDWRNFVDAITGFNAAVVFLLMATLPIGGFSIVVVYLVAGAKFGPVLGGVAVAGATAVHLVASFWISRTVLRGPIERFLERRGHRLPHVPDGENVSVAAMAVLVPGVPYFARNYLLALTDVPFRVYFWVCLPLYVARSYVTILLGDLGTDPDARGFAILAGLFGLKLAVFGYLVWRIRRRIRQTRTKAGVNAAGERRSAST